MHENTARVLAQTVVSHAVRNIIYWGVGAIIIVWLAALSQTLALVLFWVYAAIVGLSVIQWVLGIVAPGIIVGLMTLLRRGSGKTNEGLMWGLTLVRGIEEAIHLGFVYYMWRRLF